MKTQQIKQLKHGCDELLKNLDDIRRAAYGYGMEVIVNEFDSITKKGKPGRSSLHVMFNSLEDGSRMLDYWPATGTYRAKHANGMIFSTGKSMDISEVIEIAATAE